MREFAGVVEQHDDHHDAAQQVYGVDARRDGGLLIHYGKIGFHGFRVSRSVMKNSSQRMRE